jgi:hypothetical protein
MAGCSFAYNNRKIPSPTERPDISPAKILCLRVIRRKTVGVCFDRMHTKNNSSLRPVPPTVVISAQF